jgi:hypothetical protein
MWDRGAELSHRWERRSVGRGGLEPPTGGLRVSLRRPASPFRAHGGRRFRRARSSSRPRLLAWALNTVRHACEEWSLAATQLRL